MSPLVTFHLFSACCSLCLTLKLYYLPLQSILSYSFYPCLGYGLHERLYKIKSYCLVISNIFMHTNTAFELYSLGHPFVWSIFFFFRGKLKSEKSTRGENDKEGAPRKPVCSRLDQGMANSTWEKRFLSHSFHGLGLIMILGPDPTPTDTGNLPFDFRGCWIGLWISEINAVYERKMKNTGLHWK